jgi:cytidylate kinase
VSRVIRSIGLHGEAVIIGRGANRVLRDTPAFRVRLIAPEEARARALAAADGRGRRLDLEEARREVRRDDLGRRKFIRREFHADINDPSEYDAVYNLRSLEPELAADLILNSFRRIASAERRTAGAGV